MILYKQYFRIIVMFLDDFKFEKRIPGGNNLTTINVLVNQNQQRIIQKVSKIEPKLGNQKYILGEAQLMKSIKSDHVVQWIAQKKVENKFYLYMPYFPKGDLRQLLQKNQPSFEERIKMFIDILVGLKAIHSSMVIHRDLKLQNIFVDSQNNCVIGDLGVSNQTANYSDSRLGTQGYMAPEVFKEDHYDDKVDLWAVGIIAFQLFNKKLDGEIRFPFGNFDKFFQECLDNPNVQEVYNKFAQKIQDFDEDVPERIKEMIRKMLVVDSQKRISWSIFYKEGFLEEYDQKLAPRLSTFKADYKHIEDERFNLRIKSQTFYELLETYFAPMKQLIAKSKNKLDIDFYRFYYSNIIKITKSFHYVAGKGILKMMEKMKPWMKDVKIEKHSLWQRLNLRNKSNQIAQLNEDEDCLTNQQYQELAIKYQKILGVENKKL